MKLQNAQKPVNVLVIDIESDSLDTSKAKMKWFGAYSYIDEKYYLLDFTQKKQIQKLLDRHGILISFNGKAFDKVILENNGYNIYKYINHIDLWEISAPRGNRDRVMYNKNKLAEMGFGHIKNYKLKTIIKTLGLDVVGKGDIDYNIFKKNKWSAKEIVEIKKYLKKDVELTKKLFEWFQQQYEPLRKFLPLSSQTKLKHINSSAASLAYQIICHQTNLPYIYSDNPEKRNQFLGAHEIFNRKKQYKGNLICLDFSSMYPHCITMGNLFSIQDKGWDGKGYFNIKGFVNEKKQGPIEEVLRNLLLERLKAKNAGDAIKSKAYKILINAVYGISGAPKFKSLYNKFTPGNTTSMGRTIIKKLAKTLEEHDFEIIYGFTDSIYCKIPKESSEEELMYVVNKFVEEVKSKVPFPADTFKLEVESRMKFMWFNTRKSYLYVTDKNKIVIKENILNKNTPKVIMKVFKEYMEPKIIKELAVNFGKKELIDLVKAELKKDLKLSATEYKTSELKTYTSKTSIHYQISEKYGEGTHLLIPNKAMIGIGRGKGSKKTKPIRYCSIEEFKENKLKISDISLKRLLANLKPFVKKT